jgi:hypothetical protein
MDISKETEMLYHPTKEVKELGLKLCELFDNSIVNGIRIDSGRLMIDGLSVKSILRVDNHCMVEIHWYPNYDISTQRDPFCSVFSLTQEEVSKIYEKVKKVYLRAERT